MKTFSQTRLEQAITLIVDENRPIKEISIRCPYCGDSKHNPRATHMGVKFMPTPKYPVPSYHCFRCDERGGISARFLKDVGIDDAIIKKYKKYQKSNIYKSLPVVKEVKFNKGTYDYSFRYIKESEQYKYLSERFKMEFDEDDIKKFRIILNPSQFLSEVYKGLTKAQIDDIMPKIDLSRYIGFLTQDGNQAVFRATNKDIEPRFYNMTVRETEYRKLYVIDNVIDVKASSFNFVLTEGIFDLIGVYKHFYKDSDQLSNTIFVAALGKSFQEPINRLIQSGFLNFNIYLFADTSEDIDLDFYKELLDNPYIDQIYVATNKKAGEKDFGVSLDRIEFEDFEIFNSKKIKELLLDKGKVNKKKV